MDYERILAEAREAAYYACKDMPDTGACGFGWVNLPGDHPLSRHCRKQAAATGLRSYGRKGYPKGWEWWNPGDYRGQAVAAKEAGAAAFRDKLAEYGIAATASSRLD